KEANIGVGNDVQVAVEVSSVAAVSDDAMPISGLLIKSQTHAQGRWIRSEGSRVHQLRRLRLENACAVVFPVLQVRDHEMRHTDRIGGNAAGRKRLHHFELL